MRTPLTLLQGVPGMFIFIFCYLTIVQLLVQCHSSVYALTYATLMNVVRTEQFDMLLLFMINYFHWYFAMREKETYTNPVHM